MSNGNEELPVDETANFEVVNSDVVDLEAHHEEAPEEKPEVAKTPDVTPEKTTDDTDDTEGAKDDKKEEKDTQAKDETSAADEKSEKKSGFQKRINKITREREDAKRALETANRKIEELSKKPENAKEPRESEYDTYDDYLSALDKFEEKTEEKPATESKEEAPSEGLTGSQKTAMAVIQEAVTSADTPEDFEAVALNDQVPVSGEMLEAIAECENPAKVLYALGKDISLAQSISEQSGIQQVRSILKLDLGKITPPKPNSQTKAPEPITPGGGSDAQEKSPNEMSFKEYETHRNKQEADRSGGAW